MNTAERIGTRPEHARHVCNTCGRPSENTICETCSGRIRVEALAWKKHEERGNAWVEWKPDKQTALQRRRMHAELKGAK
jgi:hypothetical protein